MPTPSSSLATQRPDLAESFLEFEEAQDRAGFIASRVLPVVNVGSQSGTFGKIPIEQLLQTRDTKRAPGSGYARGNFTFTSASYATEEHGAEEVIDDREAKMYADYFSAESVASQRAYAAVLRNAEIRAAAMIFNASTFTTTGVGTEWSTIATAVPITDVEAAVLRVYNASGLWPNSMVINRKVFRNLRNCASVIDRINSAGAGSPSKPSDVTVAMLEAVFDLTVIVAGSSKNSANEGQAASVAQVWSDEYCWIGKTASGQDFKEPCVGRTFHWSEDGSQLGGAVESYRDEKVRGDVIRVRHDVDELLLYADAGQLLSNITA